MQGHRHKPGLTHPSSVAEVTVHQKRFMGFPHLTGPALQTPGSITADVA